VVKAEEVHSLAIHLQLHDPGLGQLRLQTELGKQGSQPRERGLRLPLSWA
jgi:hypothetical protein